MIRKWIGRGLILITMMMVLLCGSAMAEEEVTVVASGNCGNDFMGTNVRWVLDSEGTLTISGTGEMKNFQPWEAYVKDIINVVIEKGVTTIGNYAFRDCSSLTSITIPEIVTSIGAFAFENCSSLTSVTIPEGVTSIGNYAFKNCSSLTSVTIPEGVPTIGNGAFYNCSSLTSVTIPEGVPTIGNGAFYNCSSLTNVTIPAGVTSIDLLAFSDCSSLTNVTIPAGVTSIGSYAFSDCSSLKNVYAESLEGWLGIAFDGIDSNPMNYADHLYINNQLVKDVVIPDGVTSIGDDAFYNCSSLTSVTIPESVTSIGSSAFENCSSLTSVTIPESVTSIDSSAFYNCSSLKNVYAESLEGWLGIAFDGINSNPMNYADHLYINNQLVKDVVIPDGVTSIGDWTFYNCSSLTSVTIPEGVTSIGFAAFRGCSSLTNVTIPESVTSIGDQAFLFCNKLTIVIFYGYTMPYSISFSSSPVVCCYKSSEIDYWASSQRYSIIYHEDMDWSKPLWLTLPANCKMPVGQRRQIEVDVFPKEDIVIQWSSSNPKVVSVKNGLVTALSEGKAVITASCGHLSDTMTITTAIEHSDKQIVLPAQLKIIGEEAFASAAAEEYVLSEGVEKIYARAFADSAALKMINIPDSVVYIADDAFAGSENVVVLCSEGSYAHKWCIAKNVAFGLK